MRYTVLLATGFLSGLLGTPVWGSPCEDAIRALEGRVDEATTKAQSLSSGGQAVAASRQGQAMPSEAQQKPTSAPAQKLPEHDASATAAVTPLAGGDKAMKARAILERARALDREGDASGCDEAVSQAARELGPTQ
jgi:hypothetical protein